MRFRYLVTGGAGFIGCNIVEQLLKQDQWVRVLDNFSTGRRENIADFVGLPNFDLLEGDIRNLRTVESAVDGIDFILHQGALPSVPRSIADPITTNDVNVLGTLNVLESARKHRVRRVVYASSSSIYGDSQILPKHEEMPADPLSPYALSKYTGERYCQMYPRLFGLETVCLRYFNVFGPRQDPSSEYSAVIPKFIHAIHQNKRPVIYGDGSQSRDFTFVQNNVSANILACKATNAVGEVFNIACGSRYTLLELVRAINSILHKDIVPMFQKRRAGDVQHSLASIDKARKILGFHPNVGFDEGLKVTVRWYFPNLVLE